MTAAGLRREGARGRLVIERIAGKDYTTLAHIERMRELCRVEAKVPGSTSGGNAETKMDRSRREPHGSSATDGGTSPRVALLHKLGKLKSNSELT
jgi:hypothetical protein